MSHSRRRATLVLSAIVLCALAWGSPPRQAKAAPAPAEPLKDRYGDPLPAGAVARLGSLRLRAPTRALAFAPDGKTFATGGEDRVIHIWDSFSGQEVRQFKGHTRAIAALVFAQDGKHLIGAGDDARLLPAGTEDGIRVWDVATGRELRCFAKGGPRVRSLVLSSDQKTLFSIGPDAAIIEWDWERGKLARAVVGPHGGILDIVLSPDQKIFVERTATPALVLNDVATGKELRRILPKQRLFSPPAFSPDGSTLLAGGDVRGRLLQWEVETGKEARRYDVSPPGPVVQVGFSPTGQFLLTHSVAAEHVQVWDLEVGKEVQRFDPRMVGFVKMTFSPDGKKLAAHDTREVIRLWDAHNGRELLASEGHTAGIDDIRFSPDGKQVLTTNTPNGRARLWEAATGKLVTA